MTTQTLSMHFLFNAATAAKRVLMGSCFCSVKKKKKLFFAICFTFSLYLLFLYFKSQMGLKLLYPLSDPQLHLLSVASPHILYLKLSVIYVVQIF